MSTTMPHGMTDTMRKAWQLVRELATDDAYERYLAHHSIAHPDAPPLNRREFFIGEQCRKWSGIQRCC